MDDERLLLTPAQAAQALAISPRTLWSLTAGGQIPCVRISSRLVRYRCSTLDAWLQEQESEGAKR